MKKRFKTRFDEIVAATGKNFECEQTISGYYRLLCDGEVINDDSACEDVNGDKDTALDFYCSYLMEYEVPDEKKEVRYGMWFLK